MQQLAANRANAAKSTGFRIPEGKVRSVQSARKHSVTASRLHRRWRVVLGKWVRLRERL